MVSSGEVRVILERLSARDRLTDGRKGEPGHGNTDDRIVVPTPIDRDRVTVTTPTFHDGGMVDGRGI